MVYRGKPSAGCENCRKAKKRCGLEQPACQRCVNLKKLCHGYRDTTALQIQDESESVRLKAKRQRTRAPPATKSKLEKGPPTPATTASGLTPPSDTALVGEASAGPSRKDTNALVNLELVTQEQPGSANWLVKANGSIPFNLKLSADDLATTYFFSHFTASTGHWNFLREHAKSLRMNPLLDLSLKACGLAALDNVQPGMKGQDHARSLYAQALSLLNAALRDPVRCKTDESLMAVVMLGYYENLTCDSRESVTSWKAHINGATQLLKFRGKEQFKSAAGRMLWRETRVQILINAIWEELEPPEFLHEWQAELDLQSPDRLLVMPSDVLSTICHRFASLRSTMYRKTISDSDAFISVSKLETAMVQWSVGTMAAHAFWRYQDLAVPESPHVWNGVVHAYAASPVATVWNTYRCVRIMLTRTQELLCLRQGSGADIEAAYVAHYRSVRRQMADEICAGIPTQLGHAAPAHDSPCIIVTSYASIWPLFFATTCAFEKQPDAGQASGPSAQAAWLLSRLEYISKHVGLKWADGVAATLRGDFYFYPDKVPEDSSLPMWVHAVGEAGRSPSKAPFQSAELATRHVAELKSTHAAEPKSTHAAELKSNGGSIWIGKVASDFEKPR